MSFVPTAWKEDVVLPEPGNQTMFSYWKSRLTDVFIEDIKKAGGILCNLASDEMKVCSIGNVWREKCVSLLPNFRCGRTGN